MTSRVLSSLLVETRSGYWGVEPGASDSDALVVRNGDIQEDGIQWNRLPTRGFSEDELNRAALRSDDLLITTSGECGCVAHVEREPKSATIASNFVRLLRFDRSLVLPRYVYHFAKTEAFRAALSPFIRGTTLKNLAFSTASDRVHVPLPDLVSQARIAAILDKADSLRDKRREAITKLDQLLQSVFLNMFGDPAENPKGWPIKSLVELSDPSDRINYGVVQPGAEFAGGVPVIRVGDIDGGRIDQSSIKRIDPEIEASYSRSRLKGNELLVSCVGSIGTVAFVPHSAIGFNIARAITRVPLAKAASRPFVQECLRTPALQRYFVEKTRTVTQPTLNVEFVKAARVFDPPASMVENYCEYVAQVEKVRDQQNASMVGIEAFFASLQQRAFQEVM